MKNFILRSSVIGAWWNPFTWKDSIRDSILATQEGIGFMMNDALVSATSMSLKTMNNLFNTSINALRSEVVLTPAEFDSALVSNLRVISDRAILPVAGLLITYVFVQNILDMVSSQNKGVEYDNFNVLMLIIKTTAIIMLTTNAFDIGLGFSDLGKWIVDQVPTHSITVNHEVTDNLLEMLEPEVNIREGGEVIKVLSPDKEFTDNERKEGYSWDFKLGIGFVVFIVSLGGLLATLFMVGIMYLTAWTRMIMVLLYVVVAPIPMATLINDNWVGSIGQNYIKNLMALMLQGFFMLVLLVIYSGMMNRTATLLQTSNNPIFGLIMILSSMFIIVKMLIGTHGLAKSVMGAS